MRPYMEAILSQTYKIVDSWGREGGTHETATPPSNEWLYETLTPSQAFQNNTHEQQ